MATKHRSNPFDPAQPAKETFVGRDALLKELVPGLADGKSYELTGPAGMGKTSLLLEATRRILADQACRAMSPTPLPVYVECTRQDDAVGCLYTRIVNAVAEGLSKQWKCPCPLKVQQEAVVAAEGGKLRERVGGGISMGV